MYEVLVVSDFSGAHNLRGYQGKCEKLHGHNWKVEAKFESMELDKVGMSVDFKELKARLKKAIEILDHNYLNELEAFKKDNPSAENIAKYIFKSLESSTKEKGVSVKSVSVWESDTSRATYYE